MLSIYETRISLFKTVICVPVLPLMVGSGVSQNECRAQFRVAAPGNRVRRFAAGPGWDVSEAERVEERAEPQSEFVWNESIYQARKAAKEFSS